MKSRLEVACLLLLTAAPPALAQDQRPPVPDEIVVTARKRSEPLQETPVAVTALGETLMLNSTATRIDELDTFVPNFQLDSDDTGYGARLTMRGGGVSDAIVTRDPGVGTYLDGIYLPRAQGSILELSDVERVEVMRGPQGTLYGRNTIGGAVNVISRKPSPVQEIDAMLRIGNLGLVESRGSLNIPVIDELFATRLSFATRTRDGYMENTLSNDDGDDDRLLSGRGSFLITPNEDLEILIAADFSRQYKNARGGQCRFSATADAVTGTVVDPEGVGAPQAFGTLIPAIPAFAGACAASGTTGDPEYSSNVNGEIDMDTQGLSSTLTYDLDNGMRFRSISSWRRIEVERVQEFDFTAIDLGRVDQDGDQSDAWSQELSLSGTSLDGDVIWTTGLFGFWEKSTPGTPFTIVGGELATPAFSYVEQNTVKNQNLAAYGQATWKATDRLSVTAGVRRLSERKDWKHRRSGVGGTPAAPVLGALTTAEDEVERFNAWTGLFNLSFDLAEDILVYGQWSSGYKSGGFNGRTNPSDASTLLPFKPEKLDSFELGFKSSWYGNRLLVNAALFQSYYQDIQQTFQKSAPDGTFASIVRNAGRANIRGLEVELAAVPFAGFDLIAAFGMTDAKYTRNIRLSRYIGPGPNLIFGDLDDEPRVLQRTGEDFLNTPAYTLTVQGAYHIPTRFGVLRPTLRWYTQSEVNYSPPEDIQGSTFSKQGKYGLLDTRIALELPDGRTELALWGKNLTDRRYINNSLDFTDGFALVDLYFGAPRTFGIELRRSY